MIVEAISNQDFKDDFSWFIKSGESVIGFATRYSQKHIWISVMLDTAVNPKNDDEYMSGIKFEDVRLKIVESSIKRKKCNHCDNHAKDYDTMTCDDEDCKYMVWKERQDF